MEELIQRSVVGTGGFLATLGLSGVNDVLGFCVAVATVTYMSLSIYRIIKEMQD